MDGRAFGGNWSAERQRIDNAKRRQQAERADEQRVRELEQRRCAELAQAHRHEHAYFESVAAQVDAGRGVSPKQAATLLKIAGERGWSTALAVPKAASTKGGAKLGKIERELIGYDGGDPTLRGYAERVERGEALTQSERGKANWLLSQEGLR